MLLHGLGDKDFFQGFPFLADLKVRIALSSFKVEVNILLQATFKPPLLETIVSYLPTKESRKAAATVAYLTAISDNVLTSKEFKAFDKMCKALGLSDAERNDIRKLGASRAAPK